MDAEMAESGTFDLADFAAELASAASNHAVGTTMWFENERIRVWEIWLEPGQRWQRAALCPRVPADGQRLYGAEGQPWFDVGRRRHRLRSNG